MINVRSAQPADTQAWGRLRCALWPQGSETEHASDIAEFFAGTALEPAAVLLAEDAASQVVGVVELSLRSSAAGCNTTPVGYLEGWYVAPGARGRGVGRALVAAAEQWARGQGCAEFAFDTDEGNATGVAAHLALGFTAVAEGRSFRKVL